MQQSSHGSMSPSDDLEPPQHCPGCEAGLESLEQKNSLLCDRVRMVQLRQASGLWVHGRPGVGKTTLVRKTLQEMGASFIERRGYMTAADLFNTLEEHPESTIVLDDVGGYSAEPKFFNLMLAALDTPDSDGVRIVRYGTAREVRVVHFSGGIIFLSNDFVGGHKKVADAFRQRISVLHYDPSDAEIEAQVWRLADQPDDLSTQDRRLVARFVIDTCRELQVRLAIRHFTDQALSDYRYWKSQQSESHWELLVQTRLREEVPRTAPGDTTLSRSERNQQVVREVWAQHQTSEERFHTFHARTGSSRATMYRTARMLEQRGELSAS